MKEFNNHQSVHVKTDIPKLEENVYNATGIVNIVPNLLETVPNVPKTELMIQPVFVQMVPTKSPIKPIVQNVPTNVNSV